MHMTARKSHTLTACVHLPYIANKHGKTQHHSVPTSVHALARAADRRQGRTAHGCETRKTEQCAHSRVHPQRS